MALSFEYIFEQYKWEAVQASIYEKTAEDVVQALGKDQLGLEDFQALISPAALPYLEEMAQKSHALTRKRFGNTVQLFAPFYLSNECQNICNYCGFSMDNKMRRITLNEAQLQQEAEFLYNRGFRHVLLVTGEANRKVGIPYFERALQILNPYFSQISIEVQPLEEEEYTRLSALGVHAVLVYQETYHEENYKAHHPKGKKSNFLYRLETPDRLGRAGVHKIGLGVLLGLEDWRTDSFFCALHLQYLTQQYWQTKYSLSFPRLRQCEGHVGLKSDMSDKELVQLICAYRLLDTELELSLSTREEERFRNHVVQLGITTMSAESKTNPGGYTLGGDSLEQFEISDERPVERIVDMLKEKGLDPVFKDWF